MGPSWPNLKGPRNIRGGHLKLGGYEPKIVTVTMLDGWGNLKAGDLYMVLTPYKNVETIDTRTIG